MERVASAKKLFREQCGHMAVVSHIQQQQEKKDKKWQLKMDKKVTEEQVRSEKREG